MYVSRSHGIRQLVVFATPKWDASLFNLPLPRVKLRLNHLGAGNWRALSTGQYRHCAFHNQTEKNRVSYQHNSHYSTLASWPIGQWTQLGDRDTVLCSWKRHHTLPVPHSTQVYRCVLVNLMLGVTLQRTNIPSRGGVEILLVASCFWNRTLELAW